MVGKTLRSYRIESKLGAGGMGVVYKAVDSRLDRMAAIKVLVASAVSADREKRFTQEAKTASSLNHANIVTIYDIDTQEIDGKPVHYIAMEYVAGETLDHLIGRKGLRVRTALKYAAQIADALAAAHAAGIVHRDLKPSNVMVTPQEVVKVLDFGLAKLNEETEADAFAETIHGDGAPLTEEGTILGTVAYMSPEQAEGKKVDARSDIFSFGSMLYEMLTGQRAFTGGSKLASLSAVLHQEPQPASQTVADLPPELERIIARCMKKDPSAPMAEHGRREGRFGGVAGGDGIKQRRPNETQFSDWGKAYGAPGQTLAGPSRCGSASGGTCRWCILGAKVLARRATHVPTGNLSARQRHGSEVWSGR